MPVYEYECQKCKTRYERELSIAEKKTVTPTCPHCAASKSRQQRLISRTNFVLKGPGWAKDNYEKNNSGSVSSDKQ